MVIALDALEVSPRATDAILGTSLWADAVMAVPIVLEADLAIESNLEAVGVSPSDALAILGKCFLMVNPKPNATEIDLEVVMILDTV